MKDKTTLFQVVALTLAVVAIGAIVVLVSQHAERSSAPMEQVGSELPESDSLRSRVVMNPVAAFVRDVFARSDSLHDQAEELVRWFSSSPDTAGFSERTQDADAAVRRSMDRLEMGAGLVDGQELDLIASLYLDYLDAAAIGGVEPAVRTLEADRYLLRIEEERAEIEGRLARYLGVF